MLLNLFAPSLVDLVWWFSKGLSNFWKALLNTASKFLETLTRSLVGARQAGCQTCLFTFHSLLLVSLLISCLLIFLASKTENTSCPLFPKAWPCSKPCFYNTWGEMRSRETLVFIYTVLSITHSELPKVPFAPVRSLSSYCKSMPFTERLLFVQMFVIFLG